MTLSPVRPATTSDTGGAEDLIAAKDLVDSEVNAFHLENEALHTKLDGHPWSVYQLLYHHSDFLKGILEDQGMMGQSCRVTVPYLSSSSCQLNS